MEVWDLYDENRQPLRKTHPRGEPLSPGSYHIVVGVWVVNGRGQTLLTLRAPDKQPWPNTWENTGGSVVAGETSVAGAVRELAEETGIRAGEDELIFLHSLREGYAFHDHYLLRRDLPLDELTLQPGETVDAKWVTLAELDGMIASGEMNEPTGRRLREYREKLVEYL